MMGSVIALGWDDMFHEVNFCSALCGHLGCKALLNKEKARVFPRLRLSKKTDWPLLPANSALRPAPLRGAGFGLR